MSQITHQKGLASSTPTGLKRWFLSRLMTYIGSERRLNKLRNKYENKRKNQGREHVIEYFHQVDDGYSHLALQILERLILRYDVDIIVYIVPAIQDANFPEPELLLDLSHKDASVIAPFLGLTFPHVEGRPTPKLIAKTTAFLCHLPQEKLRTVGVKASAAMWSADETMLDMLISKYGSTTLENVAIKLDEGVKRRTQLQHYSGAMFYYEGEWYWGVDRIYHLENRLSELGAVKQSELPCVVPRPEILSQFPQSARHLTLEYYPSLRSPYTAISWSPTMKLVADSDIKINICPVLPMVMRGVPVTKNKAFYIFTDTAREARELGVSYGTFYDPIGTPVLQALSLWHWAKQYDKDIELLGAFLNAAFSAGINTNTFSGMKHVVEAVGLDWKEAMLHLTDDSWQTQIEAHRQKMYEHGLWGVPSYRLLDEHGQEIASGWGQDRLWYIAQKIYAYSNEAKLMS